MPRYLLAPALLLFAATATASDLQIRVPGTYPGKILIGQRTSVSFEIRNDGSETARDVRVVVNVTPPLLDPTLRNGFGQPCTSTGECNMPALGAGMNSFVVVSGLRTTPGPVTVTATVFAANDPNDRNNTATHVFQFVDETELDLAIQGLDRHIDLEPEQQTDVTVLVMNRGSTIATEVVLTMAFSAGTKVLGAGGDAFDCDVAVTPVVCRAASIPVTGFEWKNSVTFQIVTPPLYDGGSMTAEATIDAKEVDFIPASNREQVTANILEFFTVTNTEDAGPGSLRQAILDANAARCASRCGVGLRIQAPLPEDGFHTIRPRAPLPPLRFDGTLRGSTPRVMLDGSLQGHGDGLTVHGPTGILSMAIGNFPASGVFVDDGGATFVVQSHVGLDPRGRPAPNDRGVVAGDRAKSIAVHQSVISANRRSGIAVANGATTVRQSRIESNGASGIYLSAFGTAVIDRNVIAHNAHFGIAIHVPEQRLMTISRNAIHANGGVAIDYALDGPTPNAADDSHRFPNHPEILSATYDAARDRTIIEVRVDSFSRPPLFDLPESALSVFHGDAHVEIFANGMPARATERFLGTAAAGRLAVGRATMHTATFEAAGDLRGTWLTAVTRRARTDCYTDWCKSFDETSEVSPPFAVP